MTTSGIRLAIAGAVIIAVTAYMGYLGATSSWKYYMTVDECLAASPSLEGVPLRVSGTVAAGSLAVTSQDAQASSHWSALQKTCRLACQDTHLTIWPKIDKSWWRGD